MNPISRNPGSAPACVLGGFCLVCGLMSHSIAMVMSRRSEGYIQMERLIISQQKRVMGTH